VVPIQGRDECRYLTVWRLRGALLAREEELCDEDDGADGLPTAWVDDWAAAEAVDAAAWAGAGNAGVGSFGMVGSGTGRGGGGRLTVTAGTVGAGTRSPWAPAARIPKLTSTSSAATAFMSP
jgi:hypothetical protein